MTTAITVSDLLEVWPNPNALDNGALQPFVDIGNMVVNEDISTTTCGASMSQARLDKMASYIAAHFAEISTSIQDGNGGPLKTDKLGDASQTYAVPDQNSGGYTTTRYGQLAMALDTCGNLAVSATRLRARFEVVGDLTSSITTEVPDIV